MKNVDLLEALRSIVKLEVDSYQTDIVYDVLDLVNARTNDYFCFMARELGTWLFEQKQAYIKDTQANITWKSYEGREVSTFAIEITEKQDNKIIGNIYEIDYKKTLDDIKKNEKEIEKIEVTFDNDRKIIFDADEFKKNESNIIESYGNIKTTKNLIKEYFDFNLHQNKLKSERIKRTQPIKLEDYLKDINKKKLNEIGYKRNDIYSISYSDAGRLLEETNLNVYMIKGKDKVKIDRLINTYEKPNYGIWIEDKKRFDNFNRNELNQLIKDHVRDRSKKERLIEFGYKSNDIYILDSTNEIKSALNQNIPIYAMDKSFNKIILQNMKDVSNNLKEHNIIVVDIKDKDKISDLEYRSNQSNYIDILDKKEIQTIIDMQIREANYFDKIKEEDSKYLTNNINLITEKLLEEYDKDTMISEKIDSIIKETLKNKDKVIEGRNKNNSLKDKIKEAREKAEKDTKGKDPKKQKGIERN